MKFAIIGGEFKQVCYEANESTLSELEDDARYLVQTWSDNKEHVPHIFRIEDTYIYRGKRIAYPQAKPYEVFKNGEWHRVQDEDYTCENYMQWSAD